MTVLCNYKTLQENMENARGLVVAEDAAPSPLRD